MNVPRCVASRRLHFAALLCILIFVPHIAANEAVISVLRNAPLSLPRLAPEARKLGHEPVAASEFEVLRFMPVPRAKLMTQGRASYLGIEPEAEWEQPLRHKTAEISYISFTLNASSGTRIEIGGAAFSVEPSQRSDTHAGIRVLSSEAPICHETPWSLFGGSRMAPLNIVTVKVDRRTYTWSMWFRDSLVVTDAPMSEDKRNFGRIRVTAGKGGAWLCGLVFSDENPLFEDGNDNAVPDDFEVSSTGGLVEVGASAGTLEALRRGWLAKRRTMRPTIFVLTTPLPDAFPDLCSPEGERVHGMTGGFKYGSRRRN
jgi:hypothetical protein